MLIFGYRCNTPRKVFKSTASKIKILLCDVQATVDTFTHTLWYLINHSIKHLISLFNLQLSMIPDVGLNFYLRVKILSFQSLEQGFPTRGPQGNFVRPAKSNAFIHIC